MAGRSALRTGGDSRQRSVDDRRPLLRDSSLEPGGFEPFAVWQFNFADRIQDDLSIESCTDELQGANQRLTTKKLPEARYVSCDPRIPNGMETPRKKT